jgi:hypothetical protein
MGGAVGRFVLAGLSEERRGGEKERWKWGRSEAYYVT